MKLPYTSVLLTPRAITGNVTNTAIGLRYDQPVYAEKLNPQLPGISIEMDEWATWSGPAVGQPNQFVNTVLNQISKRTGAPMYLRVGANSEDRGHIDPAVAVVNLTFPPPTADTPAPEASDIRIGRDFYALSRNLPDGTNFQWGVNLAGLNETETLAQVSQVGKAFENAKVQLRHLEIGNEADLYGRLGSGYAAFTPQNYTNTWVKYVDDILSRNIIPLGQKSNTYMSPGGFARSIRFRTIQVWTAISVYSTGILDNPKVRKCSYNAQFAISQGSLMDKGNVRGNLTSRIDDVLATRKAGLDFVMGETNSYSNHGSPGLSNTAEATIWGVDYMLQAATLGMSRLHFHNGRGFPYSVLQPSILAGSGLDDGVGHADRPHIAPLYYSLIIVGDAICASKKAYIAELGTLDPRLSAYGVYEDGWLRRLVLVNSAVYVNSTQGGRTGFKVNLQGWANGQQATVTRLSAPYSNSTVGLTWGGQDFDTTSGEPSGQFVEETVTNGTISIEASSIALIKFK